MKKIRFILITENNLELAIKIAREIFPYEISNKGIFLPGEEYRMPKSDEPWLGYFGIKKDYRGNGVGKKMLLETLDLMKKFNVNLHTIKLYTSNREEEKGSHHLYRCVGFRLYAHRNTKPFHTYYFRLII